VIIYNPPTADLTTRLIYWCLYNHGCVCAGDNEVSPAMNISLVAGEIYTHTLCIQWDRL